MEKNILKPEMIFFRLKGHVPYTKKYIIDKIGSLYCISDSEYGDRDHWYQLNDIDVIREDS